MRRVLSALAIVVLVLAVPASPASAKGPSHMLLVAPTSGASVFMAIGDPRSDEVDRHLGNLGERVTEPVYEKWHEVDVAWMMQAIDIWRSDIVFVDGKGEAVVMTVRSTMEGEGFSTDWRRVRDGAALTALFTEMGLVGDGPATQESSTTREDEPKQAPAASVPAPGSDSSGGGSSDGWLWAVPGGLAGLLLGVLGATLVRRRTPQALAQRFASS